MKMIEVCEYNPVWKKNFELLKQKIWPTVSDLADRIEHVGSTAVEGLWAKPVIDIDIVIRNDNMLANIIDKLEAIGYIHRGNLGIEGRNAFRINSSAIKHNLYVCIEDSLAFQNHIALRDHLRINQQDRFKYSELKKELAVKFKNDIDSYIDGKTDFILSILAKYKFNNDELNKIEIANKLQN